ncbi:hypothetical protein HMPREF1315_1216 [Bifidobacterium longum subsp. longum 2-2B]|uniref:Uncharacterized protein n=1 Tax=Bifidobacterium longum subsp. longum 2-2B TaxID=1161745 RepID=A0AAV3FLV0_BIFLL|nr:hypothetical protein HMPREF1315_1216 [Bifidobacterium longum subsp. longum 2-2B]
MYRAETLYLPFCFNPPITPPFSTPDLLVLLRKKNANPLSSSLAGSAMMRFCLCHSSIVGSAGRIVPGTKPNH